MKDEYMKEYEQLLEEHEVLTAHYARLEKWEEKLMQDTEMSEEEKLLALNKLSLGYEWAANEMKNLTERAQALSKKVEG